MRSITDPIRSITPAARAAARLSAFRDATSWVSLVFIAGLFVVFFLPETKGQPMPEDV